MAADVRCAHTGDQEIAFTKELIFEMFAALDVHCDEASETAQSAAAAFQRRGDEKPVAKYAATCTRAEPYVPGEFFKRELPCLLAVLGRIQESVNLVVIDGYVSLDDKPGLGMRLWEALSTKAPVIGVAKTRFQNAAAYGDYPLCRN